MTDAGIEFFEVMHADTLMAFTLARFNLGNKEALCFTDADVDILHEDTRYLPRGLKISEFLFAADMSTGTITITLDNADGEMTSWLLKGECRGKEAIFTGAALEEKTMTFAFRTFFRGIIEEWEIKEKEASITVVNEFILWEKSTFRMQSHSCQWAFKGPMCGYGKETTWCNKTYECCAALGNTDNFGGERYLSSIEGKKIRWGGVG